MLDLRQDLSGLWQAATRVTPRSGGRVLMFMAAREGEGTSSVAASFALMAAARAARMTWLIDLDLRENPLYTAFSKGILSGVGRPGHALDASLGVDQIYSVPGSETVPAMSKLLTAHQIEGLRLLVTRFRNERLAPGQRLRMQAAAAWWDALRRSADWAIIDAPALARSAAGLTYAPLADGVVLVVQAEAAGAGEVEDLRAAVEAAGGTVIGVVMNRLKTGRAPASGQRTEG
jgi:Mrp family chromosome partitioning ATPase